MERIKGKERWLLTDESLACLLRALGQGEAHPLRRYTRLQERLTFFFMHHRASLPEDLADQSIDRLARALLEGRSIVSLEAFALGVARMILREEQARALREQRAWEQAERNRFTPQLTPEETECEEQVQQAGLEALPPAARDLLAAYHTGQGAQRIDERRQLAHRMGISMGALRKRVFDLQSALRQDLRTALGEDSSLSSRGEKRHL